MIKNCRFIVMLFVFYALHATPQTIFRESFEYPAGSLGFNGTAGNSWNGPWGAVLDGKVDVLNGVMIFSGVPVWGNIIQVANGGTIVRSCEPAFFTDDGRDVWISFLFQRFDYSGNPDSYNGLSLFRDDAELLFIGKPWGTGNVGLHAHGSGSGARESEQSAYLLHWLVVRLAMNGDGSNDDAYLWVDPDPQNQPAIIDADVRVTWEGSGGWNRIRLAGGNAPTSADCWYDEIIFSRSFKDLIPEFDTAVDVSNAGPGGFTLQHNFPNPFNPLTTIRYHIDRPGMFKLEVYDMLGKKVATLVDQYKNAGWFSVNFDGSNLPGGLYIGKLHGRDRTRLIKMLLVK